MSVDQMFCASQIVIPPTLPSILKKYAKAAIRTQPYDLLVWSAAYFRALATGNPPPVKVRLEFPLPEDRQLTLGYVKLLIYQFGRGGDISRSDLAEKWNDVCLPADTLNNILRLGGFAHTVEWDKFIAITLAFLEENLKGTMLKICEVFTEEPEGGNAMVPCEFFLKLYRYLGEMDCGIATVEQVPEEAEEEGKQPCLPPTEDDDEINSEKDIDSVIREIGDVESKMSTETRLDSPGAELNWDAVESTDSDTTALRVASQPSDEVATSRYGLEVMGDDDVVQVVSKVQDETTPIQIQRDDVDENEEPEVPELQAVVPETKADRGANERDSQVTDTSDVVDGFTTEDPIAKSTSLVDATPTLNEEAMKDIVAETLPGVETSGSEVAESEVSSLQVVVPEKDDYSSSEVETQVSDDNKPLEDIEVREDPEDLLGRALSTTDVRPTMDRETRKKNIESAIRDEEERNKVEEEATAEETEKQRIDEESKTKFHMYVPGIGPSLPEELMVKFEEYMRCCAERQADMVMPRNIRHFLCPPIDLESVIAS